MPVADLRKRMEDQYAPAEDHAPRECAWRPSRCRLKWEGLAPLLLLIVASR